MFTAAEIVRRRASGGEAALEFAKVASRVASSGWLTLRWPVSCGGDGPASVRLRVSATVTAGGSQRCRSWWVASAWRSSTSVDGSLVCPNSDSRCGRSIGDSCSRKGFGVPDVRWSGVHVGEQCPPQRGLPVEVGIDIAGDVTFPVDEQLRALPGVGREQAGQPPGDGVAAALPQLLLRRLRSGRDGSPACDTSPRRSWRR